MYIYYYSFLLLTLFNKTLSFSTAINATIHFLLTTITIFYYFSLLIALTSSKLFFINNSKLNINNSTLHQLVTLPTITLNQLFLLDILITITNF